ncbi:CPBP family intramembrane glutamic endopeptidase [Brachybacterium sp. FME24]|uniref:CPBP family intramembrane glutamic endopeptidase n=1 Tax=Brachybacterium sp. FME24 TaxID=2742605 RepID=UPI0018672C3E|nr:CPBP family intramembrane glutamic endopeptidase [Brachybacterium sp. FME24]
MSTPRATRIHEAPRIDSVDPVDRSDRRRWWQLLLGIVLFVVAEVVAMAVTRLGTAVSGGSSAEGPAAWALLLGACVGAAVALGGFLVIVGPIGRSPGLALRGRGKAAELGLGLAIGAALISLSVGLIALLGGYRVTGFAESPQLLVPLAIGIGAGVIEEVLFRGILLRVLEAWMGSWAALAITSVLFGLVHLTNDGASILTALGLVIEAGVLLGAAYLLTRRLWLAIGIHIAWNAVQAGMFSSTVSGTGAQHGLLVAEVDGPTWLTGGSMGIEGSLISVLLGLGVGIVLLVLASRRGHLLPSVRAERGVQS